MNKIKYLSVLLMCLSALNFTSCSSGGSDDTGDFGNDSIAQLKTCLYGGWKYESGDDCFIYHFSDDNSSGLFIENPNSKNYYRSDITYKTNSDITTLTITYDDSVQQLYSICWLDSVKLVLEDDEDIMFILKRYAGNVEEDYPIRTIPKIDAVDLGLSVKWAPQNVGATTPEEYGDYFAWGETEPKDIYTSDNSMTWCVALGNISGNIKYDAATACWRDGWRMPTCAEIEELKNNCTWTWTIQNNVNGYNVTGSNGNSIFLPATGWRYGATLYYAEEYGCYWTSTPYEIGTRSAYNFDITGNGCEFNWFSRGYGFSIRPVK